MTESYQTFAAMRNRWEPVDPSEQLANVERWAKCGALPAYMSEIAARASTRVETMPEGSGSEVVVVTPHLVTTHATARSLWRIIEQQFNGPVSRPAPFDAIGADQLLITGIDEELPSGTPVHPNSLVHIGPPILARKAGSLSISAIDVDARIGAQNGHGGPIAPFTVRDPRTAPNVEILAWLAHQPDVAGLIGSGEGPWMWIPGMQVHDTAGNVTARTPIISGGDDELIMRNAWNDSGVPMASIPEFVDLPSQIS